MLRLFWDVWKCYPVPQLAKVICLFWEQVVAQNAGINSCPLFPPWGWQPSSSLGWQLKLCVRAFTTCSMSGHSDMPWNLSSAESARQCFEYGNLFIFRPETAQWSHSSEGSHCACCNVLHGRAGPHRQREETKFSNCLKKVSFCQASKVLFPVEQWLFWLKKLQIAASCTLIKWSCSVLGTIAFPKYCVIGPVNRTTKKLLVCCADIVTTFCLPSLSLSKEC